MSAAWQHTCSVLRVLAGSTLAAAIALAVSASWSVAGLACGIGMVQERSPGTPGRRILRQVLVGGICGLLSLLVQRVRGARLF